MAGLKRQTANAEWIETLSVNSFNIYKKVPQIILPALFSPQRRLLIEFAAETLGMMMLYHFIKLTETKPAKSFLWR